MSNNVFRNYGFAWVTAGFFLISLAGHWLFGWLDYVNDQSARGAAVDLSGFAVAMMRETLENWQSEFLQLLWQVAGLALLLHVGSPQSKEGDDRIEAKIDAILLTIDPKRADKIIDDIDRLYEGRHTDAGLAHQRARREEQRR